jgi:hypothetical protein
MQLLLLAHDRTESDYITLRHPNIELSGYGLRSTQRENMNKQVVSPVTLPPASGYSHAIEVPARSRLLSVSGQIKA